MSKENDSIKISKQYNGADYYWTIIRDLNIIEDDNQERDFYHSSCYYEGFISAVSLLNDLMKIIAGLGIFTRVIF